MTENTEKKAINEQELRNNLQAALNQIRVLTQKNQELSTGYRISDFYQRIGWLWTFIKEDIKNSESETWVSFRKKCMEDLDNMLFPVLEDENTETNDKG